ncbi:FUSC family protein [Nocardioides caldifontis]|uniref:FUSC family protein n=1 Tax=Nocardioides caldifontis TaxID=2588938 RepID=UPI0011DFA41F|nr:FUSC family protein [Nocardioides caldifontis]
MQQGRATARAGAGAGRAAPSWDRLFSRGRLSVRARVARLRAKGWLVAQASIAAGIAWTLARDVFGHPTPFFAPVVAVVTLGMSYGQRQRRVAEVTLGVAIGVFIADLLVLALGNGGWQMTLIVALSMSTAILLDTGRLLVTQAAVQSIVVAALVPAPGQALLRWTDALIGGAVALVAATLVPGAPLRRPSEQAGKVLLKMASLLRSAAKAVEERDVEAALSVLEDARSTDLLIEELRQAADEGVEIVRSSPFRFRQRGHVRRMVELVEPLDLAIRNTRVLVRRAAVAAHRGEPVPASYLELCRRLADEVDAVAERLRGDARLELHQPALIALAEATARVERSRTLTAEVMLAQLRSSVADLLRLTGMHPLASTDAIPPLAPGDPGPPSDAPQSKGD